MLNRRKKKTIVRSTLVAAIALGLFFIPKWTRSDKSADWGTLSVIETESESEEETNVAEETAEVSTEDLQAEVTTVESSTASTTTPASTAPASAPAPTAPTATAPAPIVWGTGSVEETESEASGPVVVSDETPDASELPPVKEIPEDEETTVAATEPAQVVVEQPGESSETAPAATEPATEPTEHMHLEVQQGNYLFIYCSDVTEAYAEGFTVYRPWEDRPY